MNDINLTIAPPFARIRLNRPERRNAMSRAMWRALPAICKDIEAADEALVVVLEGADGHFCAGADIAEFDTVYRDPQATRDYNGAIQGALTALQALNRPTIAALRGNAIGGGLALALCCDLRFCASDAYLAIPPARLGLLYGFAETRRLVETIGVARAKDLLFSGRRVSCEEALSIGLVDRLCAPEALDEAISDYGLELSRLSQFSIRGAKRTVDAIARGLDQENNGFRSLIEEAAAGPDFAEGRAAFLAKRAPNFSFRTPIDDAPLQQIFPPLYRK